MAKWTLDTSTGIACVTTAEGEICFSSDSFDSMCGNRLSLVAPIEGCDTAPCLCAGPSTCNENGPDIIFPDGCVPPFDDCADGFQVSGHQIDLTPFQSVFYANWFPSGPNPLTNLQAANLSVHVQGLLSGTAEFGNYISGNPASQSISINCDASGEPSGWVEDVAPPGTILQAPFGDVSGHAVRAGACITFRLEGVECTGWNRLVHQIDPLFQVEQNMGAGDFATYSNPNVRSAVYTGPQGQCLTNFTLNLSSQSAGNNSPATVDVS